MAGRSVAKAVLLGWLDPASLMCTVTSSLNSAPQFLEGFKQGCGPNLGFRVQGFRVSGFRVSGFRPDGIRLRGLTLECLNLCFLVSEDPLVKGHQSKPPLVRPELEFGSEAFWTKDSHGRDRAWSKNPQVREQLSSYVLFGNPGRSF